jgi:hypothetical protein
MLIAALVALIVLRVAVAFAGGIAYRVEDVRRHMRHRADDVRHYVRTRRAARRFRRY